MSDTRLDVFIQNLKDTTTVLQQLELCIKNLKNVLPEIDKIPPAMHKYRLFISNAVTNPTNNWVFEFYTTDDIDDVESYDRDGVFKLMKKYGYVDNQYYGMTGLVKINTDTSWHQGTLYFKNNSNSYYKNIEGTAEGIGGPLLPSLYKLY